MRTTLSIDDDVLSAARQIAETESLTIGEVLSGLARKSLLPKQTFTRSASGVPQLPLRPEGRIITSELVRKLDAELQ